MNFKPALRALLITLGLVGIGLASTLAFAELFVISHAATPIESGDIKDIFRGDKRFAGPTKLIPIDNGPAQGAFLSDVMSMDAARYNTIWTKKSFREGLIPPTVKSGDREVIDFVRKTPGAIGYVSSQPSGVNIVRRY